MKSLSRLGAIIKKEVRQLRRDRLTFGMVFGLPIIQILLFGYAINTDVRHLRALSREFVANVGATQVVEYVERVSTPAELESLLRRGHISIGIVIPPDFDRRVVDQSRSAAQILVDGSDPTILSIATQLRTIPIQFGPGMPGARGSELLETRNIVPGLMGVILMMTMMLFTAVAIVRERERGNLELLINTPVSSAELMVGKVTPYILIGLLQLALILGVGRLLFDVPVRGSILDLYIAGVAFIAAKLSLGLLISTAVHTQFQAMQMTIFILMPSILLSGFMFPFDGANDSFHSSYTRHHAARSPVAGADDRFLLPDWLYISRDDRSRAALHQTARLASRRGF
jgi:ABC-2 type transport system permease protein